MQNMHTPARRLRRDFSRSASRRRSRTPAVAALRHRTATRHRTRRSHRVGAARHIASPDPLPRTVAVDPSPHLAVTKLHRRAPHNRIAVQALRDACERELEARVRSSAADTPQAFAPHSARLRQLLILLTGGNAEAALFVDPNTGRLRSVAQTYAAVADLLRAYRLESSPTWAFFRRWGRMLETVGTRLTGFGYISLGLLEYAAIGLVGWSMRAEAATSPPTTTTSTASSSSPTSAWNSRWAQIQRLSHSLVDRHDISSKVSVAAATLLLARNAHVFKDPTNNSVVKGFGNMVTGYTVWRVGSTAEALVTDGVSDATRARMQRVAEAHTDLDASVQELSDEGARALAKAYVQAHDGVVRRTWSSLVGRLGWSAATDRQNTKQLTELVRATLIVPPSTAPTPINAFRLRIVRAGLPFKGHHLCTSYGDPRATARDVVAAYLLQQQREDVAWRQGREAVVPGVAPKASVRAAQRRGGQSKAHA